MTYTDFKDALFAEAKIYGFSDWEIYYTAGNSFSVKVFGGEIAEYKNTDSVGLSLGEPTMGAWVMPLRKN